MALSFRKNILIQSTADLFRLLPGKYKSRGIWVFLSLLVGSILELFGLATLIPLFSVVLEEDGIHSSKYLLAVYDYFGFETESGFIIALCGLILFLIVSKNLMKLAINYYQASFSFSLFRHFCTSLHRHFYRQGYLFFKEKNSNEIVRDINEASIRFAKSVVIPLLSLFSELFILMLILLGILLYDAKVLGLLLITVLPAFFLFYSSTKKKIQQINETQHALNAALWKNLYESIFGYVDVEINNNRKFFFDRYYDNVSKTKQLQTSLHVYNQAPNVVIETAMIMGVLAIVIYGIFFLPSKTEMTLLLGVFGLAAYRVLPSVNRILVAILSIKGNQYTFGIVGQVKELEEGQIPQQPLRFQEEIIVDNLTFSYNGRPERILDRVSFQVKRGETIGIVGKSGSGKTTLANIILRFLPETSGRILIDGIHLDATRLNAWRNLIGYVQQEVYVVDGTLAENIAFGYEKPDESRVWEAIRRACLEDLVNALPQGIHTPIGERGSQISGGQRQRVGIARAIYSGAQVLVFDEATSALDSSTENEITEAIRQLASANLTMFIIAHRISTLKYCDRIIELDEGKIKDIYTYKELTVKST
ncbi:MAG: ABC transporter ATP-binding protein [Bacteroidia bacterium]|nr:ABC transporter ATP-binding protein [Bacteroidia bacterium]